eukprot:11830947-Heterocapsa_arctica.AAC.1
MMDKLLASTSDVDPLGVTVVWPISPIPPATQEIADEDKPPDEAMIADIQTGVRKEEPVVPKKRWEKRIGIWADVSDSMDEGGDIEEVPDDSADINVESDDV